MLNPRRMAERFHERTSAGTCPSCGSAAVRRGGKITWTIYIAMLAVGIPSVVLLHLAPGLIAGILIAGMMITNLIVDEKSCIDCGHVWRK